MRGSTDDWVKWGGCGGQFFCDDAAMIVVYPFVKQLTLMCTMTIEDYYDAFVCRLTVNVLSQLPEKSTKSILIGCFVDVINKTASALYWCSSDSREPAHV
tara:strand:+ start:256 stop:555 length:300 start_codon:yes stop_codon:yes gene_type:complete